MYYRIRKQEKISDIVDGLDIPYSSIQLYNDFVQHESEIHAGRMLLLPTKYTVLPDDTYESIATRFALTPDEFSQANVGMAGQTIYPGQTVFLPPPRHRLPGNSRKEHQRHQPPIPLHPEIPHSRQPKTHL